MCTASSTAGSIVARCKTSEPGASIENDPSAYHNACAYRIWSMGGIGCVSDHARSCMLTMRDAGIQGCCAHKWMSCESRVLVSHVPGSAARVHRTAGSTRATNGSDSADRSWRMVKSDCARWLNSAHWASFQDVLLKYSVESTWSTVLA